MSSSLVFLPQSHTAGSGRALPRRPSTPVMSTLHPLGTAATGSRAHAEGVPVSGSCVHAGEPRPCQGAHRPRAREQAAECWGQSTLGRFAYSCWGGRCCGEPPLLERASVVVELRQRRANGGRRPSSREYHARGLEREGFGSLLGPTGMGSGRGDLGSQQICWVK